MSRFLESIHSRSRRLGISLREDNKEFLKGKKRTTAPGQHGAKKRKFSQYGLQLQERQKLRFMYGINEKPLSKLFIKAKKQKGVTGTNLFLLLESRLDNIIYRFGLATTRRGARQIVNHNHVLVNGKKVDIPSFSVPVGAEITLKPGMQTNPKILEALNINQSTLPFVQFDKKTFTGKYLRLPEREELNTEINEALIVESYRKL